MNISEYIDDISIKCSPIRHFNGKDVFLANASFMGEDGIGRYCGIQFPQRHVSYSRNFSKEDLEILIDYLAAKEEELRKEAESLPPDPPEIPEEELYSGLI